MRLTVEQQRYADAVTAFCDRVCGTPAQYAELSDDGEDLTNLDVLAQLAEADLLGVSLPIADGGRGRSFVEECLFLEITGRYALPVNAYSTSLTAAQTYLRAGTSAHRAEIVQSIRGGRLASVTFTETGAGSDLAGVATRAVRAGDGWVIDGHKTWISFAHVVDHFLVLARTDPDAGRHGGLTTFMVRAGTSGIEVQPIRISGPRMVNDVWFRGVRVDADAVVDEVDHAWAQIPRGLAVERLIIAAMAVGSAQRAFDELVAWVRVREQFGRPIGSFQAVRHRIADLATEIAHCRAFVYDVADRVDAGEEATLNREGSMAKLKATEVAKTAALEAIQLMGGHGLAVSTGMEQQLRHSLAPTIYGGANEVQRDIIGRSFGL